MRETTPLFANQRPRVYIDRLIHVKRSLIGAGSLKVAKNQEVVPQDILGRSILSSGFAAINLAQKLGVHPHEAVRYLQKPIGQTIFKGELLALRSTLFGKKIVLSPTDGLIDGYDNDGGELKLKFLSKQFPLTAGVFGIVEQIDIRRGEVLIKTFATEVFGLFGSGKERGGILTILKGSGELVDSSDINPALNQHIVVAGSLIYGRALRKATGIGVAGVIAGGLNADDYQSIAGSLDLRKKIGSEIGISLLVTEGFGPLSIGQDILDQIKRYQDKFVFVDGNSNRLLLPSANADSILLLRRTALPVSQSRQILSEVGIGEIKIGSSVRIVWPPFMAHQGIVLSMDQSPTLLESGIKTILVTVETASRKLKVPFTNIELI